ncbi:MAG: hypothetical protein QXX68_02000 [Candidatus Pacearchaeota archaeon]
MGFRKTLTDIVGRGLLAGTLLFSPINSYAQQQRKAEISSRQQYSVEVSRENPEFSFEVPMDLYRDTTTKRFSEGNFPIYFEGRMDYDTGTFYFSYSAGKMTEEGPLLGKRNIEEAKKLPPYNVPFLDNDKTRAYFVSTGENIFLSNLKQWEWVHNGKNNPQRVLMDFADTPAGRIFMWAANKGVDYLVDKGDAFLTGGLNLVPYLGEVGEELTSDLIDEFELGPLKNLKKYLEKRAEEAKEREKVEYKLHFLKNEKHFLFLFLLLH